MTAHKRKKKSSKKSGGTFIFKYWPYILLMVVVIFLIYRVAVLVSFKVDRSSVSNDILSKNLALVNTLFIFEHEDRIVNMESVIYNQREKQILRIDLPTQVYVIDDRVESFPISSISSVGNFLKHGSEKEYTVEYIGDLLGLKFDNYVWLEESSSTTDDFLSELSIWSILFNFKYNRELQDNVYSNLPILNLIKEINFINQAKSNYDSESMNILDCCVEESIISESREEIRFKKSSFDSKFAKYIKEMVSRDVERERVNVEVYNASDVSGLASKYARKIRHTGCRILRFDNSPTLYKSSVIYVPEPKGYENSLSLVRDVVGDDVEVRYERPMFITTGDIVVVLGNELAE